MTIIVGQGMTSKPPVCPVCRSGIGENAFGIDLAADRAAEADGGEKRMVLVYREGDRDTGQFAIVQVFSHSRHRQQVVGVITLASVSNRLP